MTNKSLGTLTVDMVLQTAGFESGMDKAERIADQKTRRIEQRTRESAKAIESAFTGMANSIAAPLAAAFSVNAFAGMVKSAIDAQDHLNDLTKSTNLSVTTMAGLGAAARKSGSDLDSIAASVAKLATNMGKDPLKFAAIGVSAKDPLEALKQLSDVFVAIKDPQERAAFAAATLGKSWQGTAPLLAEGGAAIGEMVEKGERLAKVTAEGAQNADRLNDQLEDLKTTSDGLKISFANMLVPSLSDTAKAMDDLVASGNPVLALLRGFAGLGKIPFDLALGSVDTSIKGQLKDLESNLEDLKKKRAEYNPFALWGPSLKDIDRDITITTNQLEALKKFGDKIGQSSVKPLIADQGSPNLRSAAPNVRAFLDGDTPKAIAAQASEIQRLTEQLKARLITTENLTEVEKLQAQLADAKYAKATVGERDIALGIAAQIDAHKAVTAELDAELARMHDITAAYDAQEAASKSRLASLVGNTEHGQNMQRMADEALAESALLSGTIDTSTYDQIIEKLHEVKDTGEDAFAGLQSAIEGWGKSSADAFVEFAFTGKASFSDMATSILKDLAKMMIYQNVTKPLADSFSGWLSGVLPSANGNVFSDAPGLHQYVNTIQTSPKVFGFGQLHGFANGGVFAEAGPEAVMPLARDTHGRLGVRAQGGTGANVSVNVTVNENGTDTGKSTEDKASAWNQFANRIKGMIVEEMATQKRPGGMLYA